MAKQRGIIKLDGAIGDIVFMKTKDGYLAREHSPISAERIETDPAFARTRENSREFGRAGVAGKVIRNAIRTLLLNAKDGRVVSRLTAALVKVVKSDTTNTRGERTVMKGHIEMLEGFEFNINAPLSTTLYAPYTSTVDRATGSLAVKFAAFIPADQIVAPHSTTHFKLVTMGAEVNFADGSYVTSDQSTDALPWDSKATAELSLANTVTFNSTLPLFLVLGIQFYQQVNGSLYPLKNGAFNPLRLIEVDPV